MRIVALFSIEQSYDQPYNTLEMFWAKWPDEVKLRAGFNALRPFDVPISDEQITALLNDQEVVIAGFEYRLQWVEEETPPA